MTRTTPLGTDDQLRIGVSSCVLGNVDDVP